VLGYGRASPDGERIYDSMELFLGFVALITLALGESGHEHHAGLRGGTDSRDRHQTGRRRHAGRILFEFFLESVTLTISRSGRLARLGYMCGGDRCHCRRCCRAAVSARLPAGFGRWCWSSRGHYPGPAGPLLMVPVEALGRI